MTITYYDRIDIGLPHLTDRPDVEETDPYHGVEDEREQPWNSLTPCGALVACPNCNDDLIVIEEHCGDYEVESLGKWGDAAQPSPVVQWTKVTEDDDGDRPTLDMGKVEPAAVGSALVWDDDEPSVGDVEGYGHPREK